MRQEIYWAYKTAMNNGYTKSANMYGLKIVKIY
jgi:hypothetical protein